MFRLRPNPPRPTASFLHPSAPGSSPRSGSARRVNAGRGSCGWPTRSPHLLLCVSILYSSDESRRERPTEAEFTDVSGVAATETLQMLPEKHGLHIPDAPAKPRDAVFTLHTLNATGCSFFPPLGAVPANANSEPGDGSHFGPQMKEERNRSHTTARKTRSPLLMFSIYWL